MRRAGRWRSNRWSASDCAMRASTGPFFADGGDRRFTFGSVHIRWISRTVMADLSSSQVALIALQRRPETVSEDRLGGPIGFPYLQQGREFGGKNSLRCHDPRQCERPGVGKGRYGLGKCQIGLVVASDPHIAEDESPFAATPASASCASMMSFGSCGSRPMSTSARYSRSGG